MAHPGGDVPDAARPDAPAPNHDRGPGLTRWRAGTPPGRPRAELGRRARPFPPGEYPLVVVGSGPGGLQLSYSLRAARASTTPSSRPIPAPGGMFRRWPFFQRLLSWTKPYAPGERGTRAYERFDWNSLLAEEPENRALMAGLMDGTSYFPSRPEMELNLAAFAERTGVAVRYGCRWEAHPARGRRADGERFVLETSDGEYRCRVAVFAVGVAEPYVPPTPGLELVPHYAETRPAETYAGKRIFIVGKQNSGFELASGLLPWARSIVLASPSPAKLSVVTRSLVGIRARYLQPYEDHVLAGGVGRPGSLDRPDRAGAGSASRVTVRPSAGGEPIDVRGRRGHRRDGLRRAAARPARPWGGDVRLQPAAGPDAVLGERHRAGHLLRRHDQPGRGGPQEARPAGQLRARSMAPATTPGCWPAISPGSTSGADRPTAGPGRVARYCRSCSTRSAARPSCGTSAPTWPGS